jgi:plastocyanin domain-containing protein
MAYKPPNKPLIALSLVLAAGCSGGASKAQLADGPVEMEVTESGFVPANIKVKKGKPVELLITRKTDATCAKDIVIDEPKVNTALPLGKQVRVSFTPTVSGQLKFGCAMDKMIGGIITVE